MSIDHIVSKVLAAAAGGVNVLSTGEKLMAALVLNRPDWLAEWDYTIAEAIDRVGAEWVAAIPRVASLVDQAKAQAADAKQIAHKAMTLAAAKASQDTTSDQIECTATLVTYGSAPGYRDASLVFDLRPFDNASAPFRLSMRIRPEDAEAIVSHLHEVHELAWRRNAPLDAKLGESRPRWIDRIR